LKAIGADPKPQGVSGDRVFRCVYPMNGKCVRARGGPCYSCYSGYYIAPKCSSRRAEKAQDTERLELVKTLIVD
jgi:hypothetical protein